MTYLLDFRRYRNTVFRYTPSASAIPRALEPFPAKLQSPFRRGLGRAPLAALVNNIAAAILEASQKWG